MWPPLDNALALLQRRPVGGPLPLGQVSTIVRPRLFFWWGVGLSARTRGPGSMAVPSRDARPE